tara:strand:+ start:220 stop:504 length:285 start_codon:yes stop_codon:yes gene_type:complete
MTTPVEEMEEQTVIALTELLGSREEAIERYDEFVERQKAEDKIWQETQYQRDRKLEYDALNQFELQYDDSLDGGTRWKDAIQAIKNKYPKPNSK